MIKFHHSSLQTITDMQLYVNSYQADCSRSRYAWYPASRYRLAAAAGSMAARIPRPTIITSLLCVKMTSRGLRYCWARLSPVSTAFTPSSHITTLYVTSHYACSIQLTETTNYNSMRDVQHCMPLLYLGCFIPHVTLNFKLSKATALHQNTSDTYRLLSQL